MTRDILREIEAAADRAGLDPLLVQAIVQVESGGNRYATRPEYAYPWLWDVKHGKPFRKLTSMEAASKRPPSDFYSLAGAPIQEWWGQQQSWGLCIAEGTQVATQGGWVPIEAVAPGNRVLNRNGTLADVVAVSQREGECLRIKLGLNPDLVLTPNHEVFARKATLGKHGTGRRRVVVNEHPEWMPASELSEWDMLAMPLDSPIRDVESLRLMDVLNPSKGYKNANEYVEQDDDLILRYRSDGRIRARVNAEVVVNESLMELAGLYLAEGSAMEDGKGAAFAFHERETHLHSRVLQLFKEIFGTEPSYRIQVNPSSKGVQVCVYGPAARWLTKILPGTATNKQVPGWMMWLPIHKQVGLIRGMWLGDGCLGRGHYTTASPNLAYAMAHLLDRQGIVARIVPVRTWFNVGLNSHDAVERFKSVTGLPVLWPQTMHGRQRHNAVSWRKDLDFTYFPVRGVESTISMRVFDLQVPSDSSFVAGRSVVHNCQIMGAVAREHGYPHPYLSSLCDPAINLEIGCAHFAKYLKRLQGDVGQALRAYNGGLGGLVKVQTAQYALKVENVLQRLRA